MIDLKLTFTDLAYTMFDVGSLICCRGTHVVCKVSNDTALDQ